MAHSVIEPGSIKEMFDTPAWLAERTREQQAKAPYCGLGFKRGRLDPGLHVAMIEKVASCLELFRAEMTVDVVNTVADDILPALYFEDHAFNAEINQALKPCHEEWSGMTLQESACYGFRVYQRGAYLLNHVDHTRTHVISSTICVDHRLDEPWPLYLEDINGKVHVLDMNPGDMVFYEGARLIHGRPWPLKGDYYIGMFVHYRPQGLE